MERTQKMPKVAKVRFKKCSLNLVLNGTNLKRLLFLGEK